MSTNNTTKTLAARITTIMKRNRRGLTVSELTEKLDASGASGTRSMFVPTSSVRARVYELANNDVLVRTGTRNSSFDSRTPSTVFVHVSNF